MRLNLNREDEAGELIAQQRQQEKAAEEAARAAESEKANQATSEACVMNPADCEQ